MSTSLPRFYGSYSNLVSHVSPIYILEELIYLFLVLLEEMRMLDESKILSFIFLVLIEERKGGDEFRISLCNRRDGRLHLGPSSIGEV